jgi:prevent-host-death family protein
MLMKTISVSEFKATCLSVIERVRQSGQPVLITKHGQPVAELVPPRPAERERRAFLGRMRGQFKIVGDVMAPVMTEEDWTKHLLGDGRASRKRLRR